MTTISVKETTISKEEWLRRAKEIGEVAEEQALQADVDGKISDELVQMMLDAKLNYAHRPKAYGGLDLDYKTWGEMIRTIAYHNASAAWIAYFTTIHDTWPAYLKKEGRDLLYNDGGYLSDVLAPVGKVTNDPDGKGYRLSGTWNFCSGSLWSDWIGLGAVHQTYDQEHPQMNLYVVHKKDIEVIMNWDTIGLRGTGSNAIKVDDVYIPDHLVVPLTHVLKGGQPYDGKFEDDYDQFNMPYLPYFLTGFSNILVGALTRLVDDFEEKTKGRVRVYNNNKQEADNSSAQHTLGSYKMELNAIRGVADEYIDKMTDYAENRTRVLSEEDREQLFAMRGYVARKAIELAPRILVTLGGNAIYRDGHSERFVRDIIAVASHPTHLFDDAMAAYGKTILGHDGHPVW